MKRHIAATPRCKQKWEKEIMSTSNVKEDRKTSSHLQFPDAAIDNPNIWDDLHAFVPELSPDAGPSDRVEEVVVQARGSPDTKSRRYVEAYPRPVGIAIGQGKTKFQVIYEAQTGQDQSIYGPFTNNEEWELAQWLSRRVGQKAIDEYLKLSIVSPEVELYRSLKKYRLKIVAACHSTTAIHTSRRLTSCPLVQSGTARSSRSKAT